MGEGIFELGRSCWRRSPKWPFNMGESEGAMWAKLELRGFGSENWGRCEAKRRWRKCKVVSGKEHPRNCGNSAVLCPQV